MPQQPYTTENPEPREVVVDKVDEQAPAQVSPARPDYVIDDGDTVTVSETSVSLDEAVGPQDPNAVIVPPEGRGVHPDLGIVGKPTPEQAFASGDATPAVGIVDGVPVTGDSKPKAAAKPKASDS